MNGLAVRVGTDLFELSINIMQNERLGYCRQFFGEASFDSDRAKTKNRFVIGVSAKPVSRRHLAAKSS